MTEEEQLLLQVEALKIDISLQTMRNYFSKFEKTQVLSSKITEACNKFGITANLLDVNYYSFTWENFKIITDIIYKIVGAFKWTTDVSDCDNRAGAMNALISLTALSNCGSDCYCKITNVTTGNTDMHHALVIIDKDANLYVYDVDNNGLSQQITEDNYQNFIMGNWKYDFSSLRVY